jgi:hypothetical protein
LRHQNGVTPAKIGVGACGELDTAGIVKSEMVQYDFDPVDTFK